MPAQLIPDLITPVTHEQIVSGVGDGYRVVLHSDPIPSAGAVLSAQICLETGNGTRMHRFCPGNRKTRDGDQYYTMFACNEIINGKPQWFYPPARETMFAAFLSFPDGIADHFKLLACTDRYRRAWARAYVGDAVGFVMELGKSGYFTANPVVYAKAVDSISKKLLPLCGSNDPLSDEDRDSIAGQVALGLTSETGLYQHHPDRLIT